MRLAQIYLCRISAAAVSGYSKSAGLTKYSILLLNLVKQAMLSTCSENQPSGDGLCSELLSSTLRDSS